MIEKRSRGTYNEHNATRFFHQKLYTVLRTIFRTDATLSHLTPSFINLRGFLVMQAPRVYPPCFPSLDQGSMMQEK